MATLLLKVAPFVIFFAILLVWVQDGYPYPEYEDVKLSVEEKLTQTLSERHECPSISHNDPRSFILSEPFSVTSVASIIGPSGVFVFSRSLNWNAKDCNSSTIGSSWDIPPSTPGGEYTLKITHPGNWRRALGERKFQIREYLPPRLNGNIDFRSKIYGPGEFVMAVFEVERVQGGVPENAKIEFSATIDGLNILRETQVMDASGKNLVKFQLPALGSVNQALLVARVTDGGVIETFSKTIPVVLNQLEIEFFPEGGELIEGITNVVYFQASFPNKNPADTFGSLCTAQETECTPVMTVQTKHEGRGKFEFFYHFGVSYAVKVHQPSGISGLFYLPFPKSRELPQASLTVAQPVVEGGDLLEATISSSTFYTDIFNSLFLVYPAISHFLSRYVRMSGILSRNERILMHEPVYPLATNSALRFQLPQNISAGVHILTLTYLGTPVAERLIFIKPRSNIHFDIKSTKMGGSMVYMSGSGVKLEITSMDANNKPIPAVFSVKVVDKSVSRKIEPRQRHPRISDMVLLEDEVLSFNDAGSYLTEQNTENIDLLLGVQGWRKFIYFGDLSGFIQTYNTSALRSMGANEDLLADQYIKQPLALNKYLNSILSKLQLPTQATPSVTRPTRANWKRFSPDKYVGEVLDELGAVPFARMHATRAPPDLTTEETAAPTQVPTPAPGAAPRSRTKATTDNNGEKERTNFAEVVLYVPAMRSSENGIDSIEFTLSDSITTFEVMVDGYSTHEGPTIFGETTKEIQSIKAFYAEVKLPIEVSSGDDIVVPVTVFNDKSTEVSATLHVEILRNGTFQLDKQSHNVMVPAMGSVRTLVKLKPISSPQREQISVSVTASSAEASDTVVRQFRSVPKGFPTGQYASGMLQRIPDKPGETKDSQTHSFVLPPTTIIESVSAKLQVINSPVEQLNKAVSALVREPNGCFEQTSSTTYPLVMAYQYMLENPSEFSTQTTQDAYAKIERGYKRLLGFECQCDSGPCGFEWFGQAPGHEALTSYGLMEFLDMSKVYPVDPQLIQRTRSWLLSRLATDQKSFLRSAAAIDEYGRAPGRVTDAYIVWALSSADIIDANSVILSELRTLSETSNDSYQIGLIASALYNTKQPDLAYKLAERLISFMDKDGSVHSAETSITSSRGEPLLVETTSIATLVWMNDARFRPQALAAIKWLMSKSKDGKFGSTQGTILALKALLSFQKQNKFAGGNIKVLVDGKDVMVVGGVADFTSLLSANTSHKVSLLLEQSTTEVSVGYSIALEYKAVSLESPDSPPITLSTSLQHPTLKEGEVTNVNVVITNTENAVQGMVVAIVGLPAALEPRFEYLQQLVKDKKIDYFEIFGREVILYWRGFAPSRKLELALEATATVPGAYGGPASRAYLFYDDSVKHWNNPLQVKIL